MGLAGSSELVGIVAAGGSRVVGGGQIDSGAGFVGMASARLVEVAGSFSGGVIVTDGAEPVGGIVEGPGCAAVAFPTSAGLHVFGLGAVQTLAADEE